MDERDEKSRMTERSAAAAAAAVDEIVDRRTCTSKHCLLVIVDNVKQ